VGEAAAVGGRAKGRGGVVDDACEPGPGYDRGREGGRRRMRAGATRREGAECEKEERCENEPLECSMERESQECSSSGRVAQIADLAATAAGGSTVVAFSAFCRCRAI
jgi:hypothetical protein